VDPSPKIKGGSPQPAVRPNLRVLKPPRNKSRAQDYPNTENFLSQGNVSSVPASAFGLKLRSAKSSRNAGVSPLIPLPWDSTLKYPNYDGLGDSPGFNDSASDDSASEDESPSTDNQYAGVDGQALAATVGDDVDKTYDTNLYPGVVYGDQCGVEILGEQPVMEKSQQQKEKTLSPPRKRKRPTQVALNKRDEVVNNVVDGGGGKMKPKRLPRVINTPADPYPDDVQIFWNKTPKEVFDWYETKAGALSEPHRTILKKHLIKCRLGGLACYTFKVDLEAIEPEERDIFTSLIAIKELAKSTYPALMRQCPRCKFVPKWNNSEVAGHIWVKHLKEALLLPCPYAGCGKGFGTSKKKRRHLQEVHGEVN